MSNRTWSRLSVLAGLALILSGWQAARAQDEPGRVVPDAPGERSQELFKSEEAGVELLLPAGERQQIRDPQVVVSVVNEREEWQFQVVRWQLASPHGLEERQLPEGGVRVGVLDLVAEDAQRQMPGEELRRSVTPLAGMDAGIYVHRFTHRDGSVLRQVGLIQIDERNYFQMVMLSPAPDGPVEELAGDARVRRAVGAFMRSFDSIRLLDQSHIVEDQEERLMRTRALYVNLTRTKVNAALVPEQWWRIQRNGRDVGWAYVIEEPANGVPGPAGDAGAASPQDARGVRVGMRLFLVTDDGVLHRESWQYSDYRRVAEEFREQSMLRRGQDSELPNYALVVGQSRVRTTPRLVEAEGAGPVGGGRALVAEERRRLEVTYTVGDDPPQEPVVRELPAWYLPQALDHLLPRLAAPWGGGRTYLVATFVPDRREIWQKYVDVDGIRRVPIAGQPREAITVRTRLGLSGPETRHFVDPRDFTWLGSVNEETGIEVWPTTEATLRGIWEGVDLTRPGDGQPPREPEERAMPDFNK